MPSPAWRPPRRYWQCPPPRSLKPWLLCAGSLTAALVRASHGEFRVRVLHEGWHVPTRDEQRALGLPLGRVARIREVALLGRGEVWVTARSVIPVATLRGRGGRLRYLRNRSLGTLLFKGRARRGPLALRHTADGWERRSCFHYFGRPLLVRERFLPAIPAPSHGGLR